MTDHPKGIDDLKALAKALRRPLDTLYAMDSTTDPYMVDQPSRTDRANWFVGLYTLGIRFGVHVREIFYKLVSQRDAVIRVNGKPFENTLECFNQLGVAIRDARYLDLIPGDAIIDRRNPPPIINLRVDAAAAKVETIEGGIERNAFGTDYSAPSLSLPEILLINEPRIGQRYHLETWIEKSTANDILEPLGRKFGMNIAAFVGEVSSTACKKLVDRAIASGLPVRILYISDFDPGGRSMPVAAAVKIGFEVMKSGVDLDIQVEQVALTPEQCIQYNLPRTPIKESESRAGKFEDRFGAGATELDALEALHPGVLRQILIEHIERYYDAGLDSEVEAAIEDFQGDIVIAEDGVSEAYADDITRMEAERDNIQFEFDRVAVPAQRRYARISSLAYLRFHRTIETVREQIMAMEESYVADAETLLAGMLSDLEAAAPDPETFDWPEPADGDEWDDPLYDSAREYVEQVDRFREHQGKDADVRRAKDRVVTKTCFNPKCGKVFETTAAWGKHKYCSHHCADRHAQQRIRDRRKRQAAEGQT